MSHKNIYKVKACAHFLLMRTFDHFHFFHLSQTSPMQNSKTLSVFIVLMFPQLQLTTRPLTASRSAVSIAYQ